MSPCVASPSDSSPANFGPSRSRMFNSKSDLNIVNETAELNINGSSKVESERESLPNVPEPANAQETSPPQL